MTRHQTLLSRKLMPKFFAMLVLVCFGPLIAPPTHVIAEKGSPYSAKAPDFRAPGGGAVNLVDHDNGKISVTSDYWRLEFDPHRGGVLDSIVFLQGSGKNLLVRPFQTYVDGWSDENCPNVDIHSSRQDNIVRLSFSGQLSTSDGKPGPVEFQTTWMLSPFVIRADHKLLFSQGLAVSSVGIGSTAIRPELSDFGLRIASPVDDPDPRKMARSTFGKAKRSGSTLIQQYRTPNTLFFFDKGVEGFDLMTASDLAAWETGLTGRSGVGNFTAKVADDGGSIQIVREPLHLLQPAMVARGEYSFAYYIGLPRIVKNANRDFRHIAIGSEPWVSDAEIKRWADSGVNIVRLHDDYNEDGKFWHDGDWPPYDEKGMAEVRRIIATCHRYKIRVVPYFSIYEFHPQAAGFHDHEQEWRRTFDEMRTPIHNRVENGEFGEQMCPQSGWLERRKRDVERAYRELGFDGVYYDWVVSLSCNNKNHSAGLHLGSDGVIDLLAWTRRLIGPNGILIVHQYGLMQSITFENFADLVVNMEEHSHSTSLLKVDDIPTVTLLAESLPRSPCPPYEKNNLEERYKNNIAQLVLLGMFPWSVPTEGAGYDATLELFRKFKPYNLSEYHLDNAFSGVVHTAWDGVRGVVYVKKNQALVVISNTDSEPRKHVVWTIKPDRLDFTSRTSKITVKDVQSGMVQTIPLTGLADGSLATQLKGYEYRLFEIRPGP